MNLLGRKIMFQLSGLTTKPVNWDTTSKPCGPVVSKHVYQFVFNSNPEILRYVAAFKTFFFPLGFCLGNERHWKRSRGPTHAKLI